MVDDDDDDETFTVELGTLPTGVTAAATGRSVTITIKEGGGTPPPADPPRGAALAEEVVHPRVHHPGQR